jgi:diketogulonate reductase-like aldo/keto reductase
MVEIDQIADKHNVSKALVLLRWAIQHERVIIPKSKTLARVSENAKVFDFEISKEVKWVCSWKSSILKIDIGYGHFGSGA